MEKKSADLHSTDKVSEQIKEVSDSMKESKSKAEGIEKELDTAAAPGAEEAAGKQEDQKAAAQAMTDNATMDSTKEPEVERD